MGILHRTNLCYIHFGESIDCLQCHSERFLTALFLSDILYSHNCTHGKVRERRSRGFICICTIISPSPIAQVLQRGDLVVGHAGHHEAGGGVGGLDCEELDPGFLSLSWPCLSQRFAFPLRNSSERFRTCSIYDMIYLKTIHTAWDLLIVVCG